VFKPRSQCCDTMGGVGSRKSDKDLFLNEFGEIDVDCNKEISKDELFLFLHKLDESWTADKVGTLFCAIDANKNGKIEVQEFLNWIFTEGEAGKGKQFMQAASSWYNRAAMQELPRKLSDHIQHLAYVAGVWANEKMKDDACASRVFCELELCHAELTKHSGLSPGTITQIQDLAQAISLLVVAERRANGKGAQLADKMIKNSLTPLPHEITKELWHNLYNLFFAAARFGCAVEAGNRLDKDKEMEAFRRAANASTAGTDFTPQQLESKILEWDSARS